MKSNLSKTVVGLAILSLMAIPNIAGAAYVVEQEPDNTAATAQNLNAYFSDDISYLVETDAAGTTAKWSASVYGFSGDSTYDWYSFSVGMGNTPLELNDAVVFDIDFAYINGLDTILTLFDTDGTTLLKYNDDNPVDGPGDVKPNTLNPFLSYTFTTAGTYYIRVSEFSSSIMVYGDVLSKDGTYHLHVATAPEPATVLLVTAGLGYIATRKRRQRKHA